MNPRELPAAVLFDLDGTIADTEPNWINGETAVMARHDIEWTMEDAVRYIGSDLNESSADIVVRYGLPMSGPEFRATLIEEVYAIALERRTHWLGGVEDTLALLARLEIPVGLVTMSPRILADVVVEDAPANTFSVVVAGEDVERGKPNPDAYLLAARRLGVDPATCLIFEDSRPGVLAGIRAGAHVVAIPLGAEVPDYPGVVRRDSMEGIDEETLRGIMAMEHPREQ